jgi:hypothetical protein
MASLFDGYDGASSVCGVVPFLPPFPRSSSLCEGISLFVFYNKRWGLVTCI